MKKMVNNQLVDMTSAEIEEHNKQPSDADLQMFVRFQRNSLLAETDYLALSDTTLSSDMAAYRQALRDIPSQAGFPTNVTWPTKP